MVKGTSCLCHMLCSYSRKQLLQLWQKLACYGKCQLECRRWWLSQTSTSSDKYQLVTKQSVRYQLFVADISIVTQSHKPLLTVADISQRWQRIANGQRYQLFAADVRLKPPRKMLGSCVGPSCGKYQFVMAGVSQKRQMLTRSPNVLTFAVKSCCGRQQLVVINLSQQRQTLASGGRGQQMVEGTRCLWQM